MDKRIKDFYSLTNKETRNEAKVGWMQRHSQLLNFIELFSILKTDKLPFNILDAGCGRGDFYGFLRDDLGLRDGVSYFGWDQSEEFIKDAKEKYPEATFEVRDITQSVDYNFDWIISSGVFSVDISDNDPKKQYRYLSDAIGNLFKHCNKGMAISLLSDKYTGRKDKKLFLYNPVVVWNICQNFTRRIRLNHDMAMEEFSIHLYKNHSRVMPYIGKFDREAEMSWLLRQGLGNIIVEKYKKEDNKTIDEIIYYGIALYASKKSNEAMTEFKVAMIRDPANVMPHIYSGYCQLACGNLENSLTHMKDAEKIDPADQETRQMIAYIQGLIAKRDKLTPKLV